MSPDKSNRFTGVGGKISNAGTFVNNKKKSKGIVEWFSDNPFRGCIVLGCGSCLTIVVIVFICSVCFGFSALGLVQGIIDQIVTLGR